MLIKKKKLKLHKTTTTPQQQKTKKVTDELIMAELSLNINENAYSETILLKELQDALADNYGMYVTLKRFDIILVSGSLPVIVNLEIVPPVNFEQEPSTDSVFKSLVRLFSNEEFDEDDFELLQNVTSFKRSEGTPAVIVTPTSHPANVTTTITSSSKGGLTALQTGGIASGVVVSILVLLVCVWQYLRKHANGLDDPEQAPAKVEPTQLALVPVPIPILHIPTPPTSDNDEDYPSSNSSHIGIGVVPTVRELDDGMSSDDEPPPPRKMKEQDKVTLNYKEYLKTMQYDPDDGSDSEVFFFFFLVCSDLVFFFHRLLYGVCVCVWCGCACVCVRPFHKIP